MIKDFFTMEEHLQVVLGKMCEMVGTNIGKINFKEPDWYMQYEWTQKQQEEFEKWMVNYLYKNRKARHALECSYRTKRFIRDNFVKGWTFNYGWKYKKEETDG